MGDAVGRWWEIKRLSAAAEGKGCCSLCSSRCVIRGLEATEERLQYPQKKEVGERWRVLESL